MSCRPGSLDHFKRQPRRAPDKMDCAVELPRHSQLEFQHVATAPDHRADWRSYRRAREPALSATSTKKKKKKKKGQAPAESSPPSVGSMCVASFPWDVEQLLLRNCEREKLPLGGCLVRGLLTESEQQWMYETIEAHAASDSSDIATLRSTTTHETCEWCHLEPCRYARSIRGAQRHASPVACDALSVIADTGCAASAVTST